MYFFSGERERESLGREERERESREREMEREEREEREKKREEIYIRVYTFKFLLRM
jgi:hypothetical protein